MYFQHRHAMFREYNRARTFCIDHPEILIGLEKYIVDICTEILQEFYFEFKADYDEASYLHPFWANYPPENRGRSPVGDQVPWIEVGEHAIGDKLNRIMSARFRIREVGIPSGADNRFVLSSDEILDITGNMTDSAMVFLDIKSVGPRDDKEDAVLSPYQVSGDGIWTDVNAAVYNSPIRAKGQRVVHPFYPAVSPIYILSDGTITPTVHIFIKPVYNMLNQAHDAHTGQPLDHIRIICVPNGLLLCNKPAYLEEKPGLLYPGKDTSDKAPEKKRCRASLPLLRTIAQWRVIDIRKPSF